MYTRQEMIEIGQLLNSLTDFDKRFHINIIPDPKSGRKYTQVRTRAYCGRHNRKWYGKYVGPTDRYTPEDLQKAKDYIIKKHTDFVNSELRKYNCQIDDFPINKS